jgi:hypothetical protein
MPIANEFNVDLNPGTLASFGRFGSHTPYEPSAINQVGNQGQWWTQPPALEAQQAQQAQLAQQLSAPPGPTPGSFQDFTQAGGYTSQRIPWSFDYGPPEVEDAGNRRRFATPMNIGDPMPEYSRYNNITNQPDRWGSAGWFDKDDKFVGYGEDEMRRRYVNNIGERLGQFESQL